MHVDVTSLKFLGYVPIDDARGDGGKYGKKYSLRMACGKGFRVRG